MTNYEINEKIEEYFWDLVPAPEAARLLNISVADVRLAYFLLCQENKDDIA